MRLQDFVSFKGPSRWFFLFQKIAKHSKYYLRNLARMDGEGMCIEDTALQLSTCVMGFPSNIGWLVLRSLLRAAVKQIGFFLGIFPKPVDPRPMGTFRNKNVNFGQI